MVNFTIALQPLPCCLHGVLVYAKNFRQPTIGEVWCSLEFLLDQLAFLGRREMPPFYIHRQSEMPFFLLRHPTDHLHGIILDRKFPQCLLSLMAIERCLMLVLQNGISQTILCNIGLQDFKLIGGQIGHRLKCWSVVAVRLSDGFLGPAFVVRRCHPACLRIGVDTAAVYQNKENVGTGVRVGAASQSVSLSDSSEK